MRILTIAMALAVTVPTIAQDQPKGNFDPKKIEKLLDERAAKRGGANATVALDKDELNGLRMRIYSLWTPPAGASEAGLHVTVRIRLSRDGTISAPPVVLTPGTGEMYSRFRDNAVRAVLTGQPYKMLKAEHYEAWKEIDFRFVGGEFSSNGRGSPPANH